MATKLYSVLLDQRPLKIFCSEKSGIQIIKTVKFPFKVYFEINYNHNFI